MNYAAAVNIIQRCKDDIPITNRLTRREFDARAHSHWALDEIIARLMEEELKLPYHITGVEQKDPKEVIWDFICEMDWAYEMSDTEKQRFIFSTAKFEADRALQKLYY